MFTGIIESIGRIDQISDHGPDRRLGVRVSAGFLDDARCGDSIAINGACMTVTQFDAQRFEFDISAESLSCTTLGALKTGDAVNLERALALGDRLGGHLVTGHVDATVALHSRHPMGSSWVMAFTLPAGLESLIAIKGSVALDGISLTVNDIDDEYLWVNIIPHTHEQTTLGQRLPGDRVNLEVDLMARYAARLMDKR